MSTQYDHRERSIFVESLELSPEQRREFVRDACKGDQQLEKRIHRLLTAHDSVSDDTRSAALCSDVVAPSSIDLAPGVSIGPYRIREKLGEGGFGVVYLAEQEQPFRRMVALKVIKLGMDTRQLISRFEAERQALAMMDHPNIAKVFDAGSTEQGRPFFVMEYVKGERITDYCDRRRLDVRQRLELFLSVCRAIQHAHQKGVIHRDLKPSNILITIVDGAAVAKVIDFGIAKAAGVTLTEHTQLTAECQFVGTPEYMSPEQASRSRLDIDTRSDVYSLGILLYELLVGLPPFDGERMRQASFAELERMIGEEEPPRPSMRICSPEETIAEISSLRNSEPMSLYRTLTRDLDWIVMNAIEKDRDRRYATANALAGDIRNYLDHKPVQAGPPTAAYRLGKLLRRHRGRFTAAATILLVVVAGVIGTSIGVTSSRQAHRAEQEQRALAEARFRGAADYAQQVLDNVGPHIIDLLGATRATEALSRISSDFLLEDLAILESDDLELRWRAADLFRRLAMLQGDPVASNIIGDFEAALEYAQRGRHILVDLPPDYPTRAEHLYRLRDLESLRAGALRQLGRSEEALQVQLDHVAPVMEELDRVVPVADEGPRTVWADFHIGHTLVALGRHEEGLDRYRHGTALLYETFGTDADLPTHRLHRLSIAHSSQTSVLCWQLARYEDALPHAREALRLSRLTLEQQPDSARYPRDVAEAAAELGYVLSRLGSYDEALPRLVEGLDVIETLIKFDPANGAFRTSLLFILQVYANAHEEMASDESLPAVRRIALLESALEAWQRFRARVDEPLTQTLRPAPAIMPSAEIDAAIERVKGALEVLRDR